MSRSPGTSGARDVAMCRAAVRFQAGRMPTGGVGGASHVAKECKALPRCLTLGSDEERLGGGGSIIDLCICRIRCKVADAL